MSMPRHEVAITLEQLNEVTQGNPVELMTDKDMRVKFVVDSDYDQTPGRNGVELIPLSMNMLEDLANVGHTAWIPNRSPYIFGITLQH